MQHREKAGIGIHLNCKWKDHDDIFVQAISNASSALQAETQAMEVAVQMANILEIQESNFCTDNFTLVQALNVHDLEKHPGHWTIRPNLQRILLIAQNMQAKFVKIKREENEIAHRHAQEAFRSHKVGACLYKCNKHSSDECPVIAVISKQNVQYCTLQSVLCQ